MPKFSYQAINQSGNLVSGEVDADTVDIVNNMLAAQGYVPTTVTQKSDAALSVNWTKIRTRLSVIKPNELTLFIKQLRTLLTAGVPITKILEVLENQTDNLKLRGIITRISQDIREGSSLCDAFRRHPKAFSPLYCSMVQAGEASGALSEILDRLIYIAEHENKSRSDIKSAMQYPILVISFLVIAFFVLLTFVVPKFVGIFTSAGLQLPLPTKVCMGMYHIISDYWYFLVGGTIILLVGTYYYVRSDKGKLAAYRLMMRVPILGPLLIKAAMSRFASIFSILQSSGVTVMEAMKILYGTISNAAIAKELDQINERLEQGRGIANPLKSSRYFPPLVINMISIGEEAGNLEDMLNEIAKHYDDELEYEMKRLSDAIGPLLTVGLAAVVGFFALAIFLPMWDLTQMVR